MRRLGCCLALSILMVFTVLENANGQNQREVTITGSVKSIVPRFTVTSEKDETWFLNWSSGINPGEHIHITGEAEPAWLQQGMIVRLTAKVNTKKPRFLEPITSLEVVSYRPEIEASLVDENQPKGTDDLLSTDKKPPKKPKATKLPEEMTATIVGEIEKVKDGEISIKAPGVRSSFKGELAEKCKISVDVAIPGLISVGDKVTILADHYVAEAPNGGAPGIGTIKEINVEAAAKFEAPKPVKRGQKPYDNSKPTEDAKPGADEKGAAKPGSTKPGSTKPAGGKADAGKPAAGKNEPAKPGAEPKKKP
jgi:hypothetical protein